MAFASVTERYSDGLIAEFYRTGQWREETYFDVLAEQARVAPDKVFITDDRTSLTYGEVLDQSVAIARGLKRLGVGVGDRVIVQIPNWTEFAPIVGGLSRLGAVMVPIMPIYRNDEVAYIARNSGARAAITCSSFKGFDFASMYAALRPGLPELQSVLALRADGDLPDGVARMEDVATPVPAEDRATALEEIGPGVGPDDHFVIVYSSGTTARPKGCLHTFNTMACGARLLGRGWDYTTEDVQFGPSPVTHTTGLVTSILVPLIHGASSHIMESWEPRLGAEQIREHGCTLSVTATTFLQMLMAVHDPERHDIGSMRIWVSAGAPIPASLIERARELFPTMQVLSLYGRTENVTTTMCTIDDAPERSITSDGSPLPMQEVHIVDAAGNEVPRGEEGDIAYRGAMHMLEYIGNPDETAALFTPDGFSRSGDLGYMNEDGYVRVSGRLKDIVIRGGLNISVRQVEDLLSANRAVADVACVAMPDERLGERVCAYVVPTAGNEGMSLSDLTDYLLQQGLAKQKLPERLEIVDELPKTPTGKIQKHVLRRDIADKLSNASGAQGAARANV